MSLTSYLEGIFWCLVLYSQGMCIDWHWQYTAPYAPSAAQFRTAAPHEAAQLPHLLSSSRPHSPDVCCMLLLPPLAAPFVIKPLAQLFETPPPSLLPLFKKMDLSDQDIQHIIGTVSETVSTYTDADRRCVRMSDLYLELSLRDRPLHAGQHGFFLPPPPLSRFTPLRGPSHIRAQYIRF
jgi:hypothetical protein